MKNTSSLKRFSGVNTRVPAIVFVLSVIFIISTCCTGPIAEPTASVTKTPRPTAVPTNTTTPTPTIVPTPVYPEINVVAWATPELKNLLVTQVLHMLYKYLPCQYGYDYVSGQLESDWINHYHIEPYLTFVETPSGCGVESEQPVLYGSGNDGAPIQSYLITLDAPVLCQIIYEYYARYGGAYLTWDYLTTAYGNSDNPEVYCELFDLSKTTTQPGP
jgi:hypothetical protein